VKNKPVQDTCALIWFVQEEHTKFALSITPTCLLPLYKGEIERELFLSLYKREMTPFFNSPPL